MNGLEGIQPKLRQLLTDMGAAVSGSAITMVITPATWTPKPTSAAWESYVAVTFKCNGSICEWMNGITISASVADSSTAGTATIDSATPAVKNGVARIKVIGDAAAWLNSETVTVTIANKTVLGATVTGGTSVATFTT